MDFLPGPHHMHDDRRFAMVLLEKPCQSLADLIGIMGGLRPETARMHEACQAG